MPAITTSSPAPGARIADADLARLDNAEFNRIYRALLDHLVMIVRRQSLTAGEFLEFAKRFGELQRHPQSRYRHPKHPEILVLSNAADAADAADADNQRTPAAVILQYALEIAADSETELTSRAAHPEFRYRHRWQVGDVMIWDNRCVMHSRERGTATARTLYQIAVTEHV